MNTRSPQNKCPVRTPVGCAVDGVADDAVGELEVVGDNGSGEVCVHALARVKHLALLISLVGRHDLHRACDLMACVRASGVRYLRGRWAGEPAGAEMQV